MRSYLVYNLRFVSNLVDWFLALSFVNNCEVSLKSITCERLFSDYNIITNIVTLFSCPACFIFVL